jgi:hypothetical protein
MTMMLFLLASLVALLVVVTAGRLLESLRQIGARREAKEFRAGTNQFSLPG